MLYMYPYMTCNVLRGTLNPIQETIVRRLYILVQCISQMPVKLFESHGHVCSAVEPTAGYEGN